MSKFVAEFIGTFALVLFGCGAAVLGGEHVGQLGIALAFGFAIVAMAYGIGPVSGCHVNPAVSLAAFVAGRMSAKEMVIYWVAQFAGATAGAGVCCDRRKHGRTVWARTAGVPAIGGGFGCRRLSCSRW
jgi:aquaporin Z